MGWTRLALRILRSVAIFIGHFLTAVITTNIFDNELGRVLHLGTVRAIMQREYAFNATIAFALGYFVFYKWHSDPGKWIWVAGMVLLAEQSLSIWRQAPHSVLAGGTSLLTVCSQMFELRADTIVYVLTLVRTIFYSLGAWACWYATRRRIVPV